MLCINKISFPCGTKMMDRASFPCFIFFTCFTHWRKFVQNFNSHQLTYFFRGTHIGILFLGKVSSSHIFFSFQVHNYKYVPVVWRVVQNKWNKSCGLCPRTNMAREFSQKLGPYRGYLTNEGRNLTVSNRYFWQMSQVKIVRPKSISLLLVLLPASCLLVHQRGRKNCRFDGW